METKPPTSRAMYWGGWVLSILPTPLLLMGAVMKITNAPVVVEGFAKMGWPEGVAVTIGLIELACTLLYLIPRTAVLGAILLTGYLGGAIATHVQMGDAWYGPFAFGVVLWLGLFLRDHRVRALVPWRFSATTP